MSETTLHETIHKPKKRFGELSESELVDMLKAGDDNAWRILYDGFYTYVFQLIKGKNYRISDQDAEDICHDVFEDLVKGIQNFRKKSILKTYIHALAINRIRQYYRKILTIKRGSGVESISLDDLPIEIPDNTRFSPEFKIMVDSEYQTLKTQLGKLPEVARQALMLRYIQNMKYKEISDELCIPEGSVGALIQKSLVLLRKIMLDEESRSAA
ncbi:RNA polymerase sigma factor [bacterium]|nr:RNA polymerase sigma factor [bacterium]MBU1025304.1 RNA polymerase sigma factor [bacterium]